MKRNKLNDSESFKSPKIKLISQKDEIIKPKVDN